jgi:hypothetical protein
MFAWIVSANRRLVPQRFASQLTATVGNYLVQVHVELRAASRHPHI